MQLIGYLALRLLIFIFWLIPFPITYLLSNGMAFIFYNFIPYRKKLIIKNLKISFPEKSDKEIKKICKQFYLNLSDIILEALKGLTMSGDQIIKRYKILPNPDLDKFHEEGRSVLGLSAHFANWEWGPYATGLELKHHILGVYKKLNQPYINDYLISTRAKFDVDLSEMKETSEKMEKQKKDDPILLMLIADQSPTDPKKAVWKTFLNRETAFFYGPEKFMREYDLPVFYFNIFRIKRGYYQIEVITLCKNPSELKEGEIVDRYRDVLEKNVIDRPHQWLWSHNRWKHQKPDGIE